MDHMMPVMDGIEATHAIRALPDDAYRTLPIIALTANAMIDARNAFFEAGMNDFTAKPIDFKAICTKMKRWLPKEKVHTLSKEEAVSLLSSAPAEDKNILPKPDGYLLKSMEPAKLHQAVDGFFATRAES